MLLTVNSLFPLFGDARQISKWGMMQLDANPDSALARQRAEYPEQEWRFHRPTSVAFDTETNRLIVTDTVRRRIQVYVKETDYQDPQLTL